MTWQPCRMKVRRIPVAEGLQATCRVLEGFCRAPFARFTSQYTNRRCDHNESMVMIGASIGDMPAGLAVIDMGDDNESHSLESIFVEPGQRRRGVGRALLGAAESLLASSRASKLTGSWYHDGPSASAIEHLLADAAWTVPKESSILHRAGHPFLEYVDRTNRPWRPPPGIDIKSWSSLTAVELQMIDDLRQGHQIGMGLHPEGESMLAISEETSVVLRDRGEVAGWMLHHIIRPGLTRYSSLWIRPDLIGRGFGISLGIESIRRHLAVSDRSHKVFFLVAQGNDPMHRFIARRLQPAIVRSSILMRSEKAPALGASGS